MTLAIWTQFFRNFLCIVKTLSPETAIYMALAFPNSAYPFNRIMIIEALVAITQLAAVFFMIISSYKSVVSGYRNLSQSNRLLIELDKLSINGVSVSSVEHTILRHALECEKSEGGLKRVTGFWEFVIGICFIFLLNNSLHLHGPTHPLPLINALFVMEIGLAYFLYLMWNELQTNISLYFRLDMLLSRIESLVSKAGTERLPKTSDYSELRLIQIAADVGFLDNMMKAYKTLDPSFIPSYNRSFVLVDGLRQDLAKINLFLTASAESDLSKEEIATRLKGYLELIDKEQAKKRVDILINAVVLSLNVIAFYGYMMAILSFYYPNASLSDDATVMEYFTKAFCFNLSLSNCEWYGAFAGDLAWTLEPIFLLLFVPFLRMQRKTVSTKLFLRFKKKK